MRTFKCCSIIFLLAVMASCTKNKTIGSIERIDPELDSIIDKDAKIEVLAEGYDWSEGPVWVESNKMLLFSDVPKNTIYKWTEENGAEVYLTPSGYTGTVPRGGEMGSNGLHLNKEGQLVLCQHGDRRVAFMDAPLDSPSPNFVTLADSYNGKRFSSPNDAEYRLSNGDLYISDPPYGLPNRENDSTQETPYNGVYRLAPTGFVTLLVDSITRPNGIAFFPGDKTVIIANSDPAKAIWYAFDITEKDSLTNGHIFYNATAEAKNEKGLPDGLKIDKQGHMFASGPGGLWIFNEQGKVLGKVKLPEATSNCALSDDNKTLYITSDMYVLRIKMRK